MPPRSWSRTLALVFAFHTAALPRVVHAGCNLIPPTERSYPSTLGGVASAITIPGRTVEIRLGPCDASPGFDPVATNNVVTLTFTPPAGPSTAVPITSGLAVANCIPAGCGLLTFVTPDTTGVLPPNGLAGPARITVLRGVTTVADIGPLFEPRPSVTACSSELEPVFEQFTVLPPANDFAALASGAATQLFGTLDGGGDLLVPFNYLTVLPLGPGEPVARLVSAFATLDAFSANPGVPIVVPDTSFARSFTVDGRPLPPLLRATSDGESLFGTTDAAQAIIRVARTDGADGPPIFDLSDRLSNGGRGPIVMTNFSAESGPPVPLANLHSSTTGVAYTRDESLEGNLNGASGDTDSTDRIVQIVAAETGASASTGMAAANPHSPIVGPAAVTTAGGTVAFLESEADQNATDLNGDGDSLDSVLRVFDLGGTELTSDGTLVGALRASVNRQPLAVSGPLVFYREPAPGVSPVVGSPYLSGATLFTGTPDSVAVSPDGRVVSMTLPSGVSLLSPADSGLAIAFRDPETGACAYFGDRTTSGSGPSGLDGATGIAFSPDSRFLYVAGSTGSAIGVFAPMLRFDIGAYPSEELAVVADGVGGVDGLAGVTRLAISPDGRHLYASGTGEDAIAVFARDQETGTLAFVEALFDGSGGVSGLDEPRGLAFSPDGKDLYVAAHGSSAVTAFTRDPGTGALTFLATYADGGLGGPSLGGPVEVAVSADGQNVYVAANTDSAISVFSRDPVTGALTFVEAKVEGVGGVTGIGHVRALAITPDAHTLYAGGDDASSFAAFERLLPGGTLGFVEAEGFAPFQSQYGTQTVGLAVSPDSENVYALWRDTASGTVSLNGVYSWERNARLRAFDTGTGTLRAGLGDLPASVAAVAAGRAVFLSEEGGVGGTDRNGDGDTDDVLAYAYDAATDVVTQLTGVSAVRAVRIALSNTLLAVATPQDSGVLLGVLPVSALTSPPEVIPVSVALGAEFSANSIGLGVTDLCSGGVREGEPCQTNADCTGGACSGVVVFGSRELTDGPHGTDLNHDGDTSDVVLAVYDAASGQVTYVPQETLDFEVGGNLVAFRSAESGTNTSFDFNGDGDTNDTVLFVYDLKYHQLINTHQAVVRCELPGCTPGLPYKIVGDSVAFLTKEQEQGGTDLDGDGKHNGTVAQVFDVRSARRKVFGVPQGAPNLPPLPDELVGGPIVYREVLESDIGVDVNQDGDFDDVVNLVNGDNDGDGIFNDDDTCVETPDADGRDSDLDGLGDVCDPHPYCSDLTPASPPLAPTASAKCQEALGKATRGYLMARANAMRGCLDALAKGKRKGGAAMLCRGSMVRGQEVLPADEHTASKLVKARAKLDATIAGSCRPADLAALDPCASSTLGVQQCLAERVTTAANAVVTLAYGDEGSLADKAELKCQQAIGGAVVGYVKALAAGMTGCLDQRNKGDIVGDGQAQCLGAGTIAGVTAPAEDTAATKITKAAAKLRSALDTKCSDALLGTLKTCGTTRDAVDDCLTCTGWRQVVEAVRGAYGVP